MAIIKNNHKNIYITVLILLILIFIGFAYFIYKHGNQIKKQPVPKSTITKLPQSSNSNNQNKQLTTSTLSQGTSTSTTNTTPVTTTKSQWIQSQSGSVTLQQPITNSYISTGFALRGLANVSQVNYTLLDNKIGVISQGIIPVENGSFSAIVNFGAHSSSGRLDVYSTDPNGREINEVQIPINFN